MANKFNNKGSEHSFFQSIAQTFDDYAGYGAILLFSSKKYNPIITVCAAVAFYGFAKWLPTCTASQEINDSDLNYKEYSFSEILETEQLNNTGLNLHLFNDDPC